MKRTIENLAKAYVGECQARNRYTFAAKSARKEGFEQTAEIFMITAENERQHAKQFYTHLLDLLQRSGAAGPVVTETDVPVILGSTAENLAAAAGGEHHEHSMLYPRFADDADAEGLHEIARRFRNIARAEAHHEERFRALLAELDKGTTFRKEAESQWFCRECGYPHTGVEPPAECPSCGHPRAFFQIRCERY